MCGIFGYVTNNEETLGPILISAAHARSPSAKRTPACVPTAMIWLLFPKSDAQISALLGVLPLQLLSYLMSVLRGFDPDFPRNLSKTLTVD